MPWPPVQGRASTLNEEIKFNILKSSTPRHCRTVQAVNFLNEEHEKRKPTDRCLLIFPFSPCASIGASSIKTNKHTIRLPHQIGNRFSVNRGKCRITPTHLPRPDPLTSLRLKEAREISCCVCRTCGPDTPSNRFLGAKEECTSPGLGWPLKWFLGAHKKITSFTTEIKRYHKSIVWQDCTLFFLIKRVNTRPMQESSSLLVCKWQ